MKENLEPKMPEREFLAANGSTTIRNGGCYEEYLLQGARYGCGWNGVSQEWVTRRLKPKKH